MKRTYISDVREIKSVNVPPQTGIHSASHHKTSPSIRIIHDAFRPQTLREKRTRFLRSIPFLNPLPIYDAECHKTRNRGFEMKSSHRKITSLLSAVFVVCCSAFTGCSGTTERNPPEVNLGESRILVVPFQERSRSVSTLRWHYESSEGIRLARLLTYEMSNNCPTLTPLSDVGVEDMIFHSDTEEINWTEIGNTLNATHVLTGRIEKISYSDPRTPGMLQGRMVVRWWVYRVFDGHQVASREFSIRIPEDPESGKIYISFESSERELLAALQARMAKVIGRTLCGEDDS